MTPHKDKQEVHSVKHFAEEALHDVLHFDRKFFTTMLHLVFKPGRLTTEISTNQGSRYMKPLGLFIFINFLFFIFKSHGLLQYQLQSFTWRPLFNQYFLHKLQASRVSYEVMEASFNTSMKYTQKGYFIFLVPILALGFKVLFINQRRSYVEHLVFCLHLFSFFLLYLLILPLLYVPIFFVFQLMGFVLPDNEVTLLSVVIPVVYLWLTVAMKRVYSENWGITIIKSCVLIWLLLFLVGYVYRVALFYIVLHSI